MSNALTPTTYTRAHAHLPTATIHACVQPRGAKPYLVGWEREGPNHVLLEALPRNVGPHPGRAHRHELDGVAVRLLGGLNERVGVVDLRLMNGKRARGGKRNKQCIRM
jgi:hypothetical protein